MAEDKIKNYRRNFGGVKSVEPDIKILDAKKYVIPPLNHDVFKEFEESECTQDEIKIISSSELKKGDVFLCEAAIGVCENADTSPVDGNVL